MSIFRGLFYEEGKNIFVEGYEEIDPATWPPAWSTTFYKEYPRFENVPLIHSKPDNEILKLLSSRRSNRNFSDEPITLESLAKILKFSCGEFEYVENGNTIKHRIQPSGGARYPVEAYLVVFSGSNELACGVYHYNVKKHILEKVPYNDEFFSKEKILIPKWSHNTSVLVVLTGIFWRTEMKYRERGSWYTFLEAGHIAQNIHLLSKMLNIKSVGLGGVWDDSIESLLELEVGIELPLHSIALGS